MYVDYLIRYSEEFNREVYEQQRQEMHKADYANPEGHDILANGGPDIYADWLEEREKPNLAALLRNRLPEHDVTYYNWDGHLHWLNNRNDIRSLAVDDQNRIHDLSKMEASRLRNGIPSINRGGKLKATNQRRIWISIPNPTHESTHNFYMNVPEDKHKDIINSLIQEGLHSAT